MQDDSVGVIMGGVKDIGAASALEFERLGEGIMLVDLRVAARECLAW